MENTTLLSAFENYLRNKLLFKEKYIPFYVRWVNTAYESTGISLNQLLPDKDKKAFIKAFSHSHPDWQTRQAEDALRHYSYFISAKQEKETSLPASTKPSDWEPFIEQMCQALRLKHRSYHTEKSYVSWVESFRHFLKSKSPERLTEKDIQMFLSHLTVEKQVAASTQNQALNALIFFFRHALEKEPAETIAAVRSYRKPRLPVVLSREEINAIFSHLSGIHLLMAQLIYGCGLRLRECLHLRVKDIDFERNMLIVRSGKGDKDRRTLLPESLKEPLRRHLQQVRRLFENDRSKELPGVYLPGALERKYPNASTEWAWFWVFPSKSLSVDPRSHSVRRHHLAPSTLQKVFKRAVIQAGIAKQATVHSLRHSFATHLLEKGYDIRTIQELMGHRNVKTTMIYTHVARRNVLGVRSPLDE